MGNDHSFLRGSLTRQISLAILATSVAISCGEAMAQLAPYAQSSYSPYRSNLRVTYGGNVIMDMGNYDIIFGSPNRTSLTLEPTLPEGLSGLSAADAATAAGIATAPQIIFKSPSGLRWDGSNYFSHPAYPSELVNRQRYLNRVVGRGKEKYPPTGECTPAPCVKTTGTLQLPQQRQQMELNSRFNEYARNLQSQRLQFNRTTQELPLTTASGEPNRELCNQYPYLVQCRPAWSQPKFAAKPRIPQTLSPKPVQPRPRTTPEPQWTFPRPDPERIVISKPQVSKRTVIVNQDKEKACSYTLLTGGQEFSFTLQPGERHEFLGDQERRIRFDSQGWGTMTYQLHAGDNYDFTKNKSDVWQLNKPAAKETPSILP